MIRSKSATYYLFIPVLFLLVFYIFPMAKIAGYVVEGFLPSTASQPIHWGLIQKATGFTLYQALLSSLITMLIGLPAAFVFGKYQFIGKPILRVLFTLPFILPTVVVVAGFNALLGPNGWVNVALMRIFHSPAPVINSYGSLGVIILAHVFYNISVVIRVVATARERFDPDVINAAALLGAKPHQIFLKIILPILWPHIFSAFLLVFLFDFTSFGVILMLGGASFTTLEVEIYIQTMQLLNLKMAGVLSLIQLAFTVLLTVLSGWMENKKNAPLSPNLQPMLRKPVSNGDKVFVFCINAILIGLLVFPVAALFLRSITAADLGQAGGMGLRFTLRYYASLFTNQHDNIFFVPPLAAVGNSFVFAGTSMLLAVTLGLLVAFSSTTGSKWSKGIQTFAMLPLGTSAVTLGLGFAAAFANNPALQAWSVFLIPIAHTLVALPFVIRIIQPALGSIPSHLHDAAMMLGVRPNAVWKYIDLPIIRKPLSSAAIYAFAISLGEFGATAFLTTPEFPTIPIAIFRSLNLPGSLNYGKALALSVILLLVCAAGFILIDWMQGEDWLPQI